MNAAFSIPHTTADRLSRLALACDTTAKPSSTIAHIALRVTTGAVRFCATDGRLLASMLIPVSDQTGDTGEVILDGAAFTAAIKAAGKATGRISIAVAGAEARVSNGPALALVRTIPGAFPSVDHVWSRPAGKRWVPTISTLDVGLMATAQRITGSRQPLRFSSPVEPTNEIAAAWSATEGAVTFPALRAALNAPAYWADHELAILLMPITTAGQDRRIDVRPFALPVAA